MNYDVFQLEQYPLPLPENHRFPAKKYAMIRRLLIAEKILAPSQLKPAPVADFDMLNLAHDRAYIRSMADGSVSADIMKRVGFPWTPELFTRVSATVGGAVASMHSSLRDGIAGCLAGGTHHAHYDFGSGYCVFNDLAVASRVLTKTMGFKRVAIVDLDVHQGDGNSAILADDPEVMVLSLHGDRNFPFRKVASTLDVPLATGTSDEDYLIALDFALEQVAAFEPQFIFYQMGVDALKEDKLGKLDMTFDGLMERDRRVLNFAKSRKIPISLALGGGYADPIELSVRAYANTYRVVNQIYQR
ncbi:histone deacetylase [soil metagenome]